jgi:hypothetical protein
MTPAFAYTQSRIQARFAALADETVWQGLEAARSLSGYLEETRRTAMAHWVSGISLVSDTHQVERQLLRSLASLLEEAASWTPEPWRAAVRWLIWLPELPLLERLIRNRPPAVPIASNTLLDTGTDPHTDTDLGHLPRMLAATGSEALLPDRAGTPLSARWLARWRRLWPPSPRPQREAMEQLTDLVARHHTRFGALTPDLAWEERRHLGVGLRRLFRRHALGPVALFSWLGLEMLALERLRGALAIRACFPVEGTG